MTNIQRIGGVAALIEAATFTVGIIMAVTVLSPFAFGELRAGQIVPFLAANQLTLQVWNAVIYLVFGVFLVILAMALYERLKPGSTAMVKTATIFGFIWATLVIASGMIFSVGLETVVDLAGTDPGQAASAWVAIGAVQDGLGGGVEIVGAIWILLLSWAALRDGGLPKALNYLGVVISMAGILTVIPSLGDLGALFGLGSIVWFTWLGVVMLRENPSSVPRSSETYP